MKIKFIRKYLASVNVPEINHTVDLVNLYQRHTYSGLLEGMPNTRINELTLNELISFPAKNFGNPETYLIPPKFDISMPESPLLPFFFSACMLESDYETDEESAASSLCVLWLHDNPDMTPFQILNEVIKRIDWSRQAKGFLY